MTTAKRQNPLVPILICASGWLFGQGIYEMVRPAVLEDINAGIMDSVGGENSATNTPSRQLTIDGVTGTELRLERVTSGVELIEV